MGSFSRKMLGFFISLDSNPFLFFLNTFTLPPIIKESDGLWMMHPEVPDWWGCLCVVPCATSRTSQKYVYIYIYIIYLFIYFHSVYKYILTYCVVHVLVADIFLSLCLCAVLAGDAAFSVLGQHFRGFCAECGAVIGCEQDSGDRQQSCQGVHVPCLRSRKCVDMQAVAHIHMHIYVTWYACMYIYI